MKKIMIVVFASIAAVSTASAQELSENFDGGTGAAMQSPAPVLKGSKAVMISSPFGIRSLGFQPMRSDDKLSFLKKLAEAQPDNSALKSGSGIAECWAGPYQITGGVESRSVCCIGNPEPGVRGQKQGLTCHQDYGRSDLRQTRGSKHDECVNDCIDEWLKCCCTDKCKSEYDSCTRACDSIVETTGTAKGFSSGFGR